MNKDLLEADLIAAEGKYLTPYLDHLGNYTVGVGRNLSSRVFTTTEILYGYHAGFHTEAFVMYLLHEDITRVEQELDAFVPWWRKLSERRQRALANMLFQLGLSSFTKFVETLELVRTGRFTEIRRQVAKSLWIRQTPKRAHAFIEAMEQG